MTTQPTSRVDSWPAIARVPWRMASEFVDHVLVEPYRDGRLKRTNWPKGVTTIAIIALVGWVTAVVLILFSGAIREALPLYVSAGGVPFSFPRPILWVFFVLLILSIALLQTAAIHVTWWLSTVVTALTVLIVLFLGVSDVEFDTVSAGRIVTIITAVLLVGFVLLRRRKRFAWWEFAVVFGVLGLGLAVTVARLTIKGEELGTDASPISLSVVMFTIGQLAIPSAIAAGSAVAELATSSALRAVGVVRRHLPVLALALGLAVLVVWRGWVVVETIQRGVRVSPLQFVTSALIVALIVTTMVVLARVRGRRRSAPPSATELTDKLGTVAQPIGAGLAIAIGPYVIGMLLFQVIFAYLGESDLLTAFIDGATVFAHSMTIAFSRLVVGILLLVLAVRWAKAGRRIVPELLGSIGLVVVTLAVAGIIGPGNWLWSSEALSVIASVICVALLGWYLATRALTTERMTGLAVALLLTALFQERDFVSDPLGALLGFTGIAFVLFGYVWGFLTSGSYANKGSRRFPRASRILLFLASTLFGVTVLAYSALARNPDAAINLGAFAAIGDQVFGTAILIGALTAVIGGVLAGRDPDIELDDDTLPDIEPDTEDDTDTEARSTTQPDKAVDIEPARP